MTTEPIGSRPTTDRLAKASVASRLAKSKRTWRLVPRLTVIVLLVIATAWALPGWVFLLDSLGKRFSEHATRVPPGDQAGAVTAGPPPTPSPVGLPRVRLPGGGTWGARDAGSTAEQATIPGLIRKGCGTFDAFPVPDTWQRRIAYHHPETNELLYALFVIRQGSFNVDCLRDLGTRVKSCGDVAGLYRANYRRRDYRIWHQPPYVAVLPTSGALDQHH